jgi:hypothetical protein
MRGTDVTTTCSLVQQPRTKLCRDADAGSRSVGGECES